jgi:hypothetical protein
MGRGYDPFHSENPEDSAMPGASLAWIGGARSVDDSHIHTSGRRIYCLWRRQVAEGLAICLLGRKIQDELDACSILMTKDESFYLDAWNSYSASLVLGRGMLLPKKTDAELYPRDVVPLDIVAQPAPCRCHGSLVFQMLV